MSSISRADLVWVGLDVHKDAIHVGLIRAGSDAVESSVVFNDETAIRKAFERSMGPRTKLRVCYEAGPTGFGLARQLQAMGISCGVAAPSLIPKASGDRVKTDKRDARQLARLHRAGVLVMIRIPTPLEEAVRDLCRARADMVEDLTRARNRLGKFLLRHSVIWRGGSTWTLEHRRWLETRRFDDVALQLTYSHYRAVLASREAALDATSADLAQFYDRAPFADTVLRLACYRGVDRLGALTIASEVCDFRRFSRAEQFCGFTGLVPGEHSSGKSRHQRPLTKSGNAHLRTQLVESAWAYQHQPAIGATLRRRHDAAPPETIARAWAAQLRLCGRFRHLASRKNVRSVVTAAVARELAGFLWAEMTS
ncbi:MAG TPA: IS110 family transposase [Acidimicrobiales bacterium]|nr:IS110 family transposase [Acidimicrobiales bacterium]